MSCLPLHLETKTRYWCRNAMKSSCRQVQEWGGGRNESSKNHGLQMQIPRAVLQDLFIQQKRIILTSLMIYTHSRGHCFNLDKTWDQVQCQTECRWSKALFLIHSLIFTGKKSTESDPEMPEFFFFSQYILINMKIYATNTYYYRCWAIAPQCCPETSWKINQAVKLTM